MHICQLTRIVWEHGIYGGMEQHSRSLVEGLTLREHDVLTITTSCARPASPSPRTIFLPHTRPGHYSAAWWQASVEAVERIHQETPIDLVWSQSSGGLGYILRGRARIGVPCVVTLHGTLRSELKTRLRNISSPRGIAQMVRFLPTAVQHSYLWRKAVPLTDRFIAVSKPVADSAVESMDIPVDKIEVIPNGVDEEHFRPLAEQGRLLRQRYGIAGDAKVLVTVGRLEREKGVQVAIKGLPRISQAVGEKVMLLIVGQGRHEEELKRIAKREGLFPQVFFCGFVAHQELPAFYNAGDLFLMPTLREEGLPLVLAEAMACGKPVVASHIGGIPTIVKDEDMLFWPGDVEELTLKAAKILADESLAARLGEEARATICARFTLGRMVEDTARIFEGVKSGS